MSEDHIDLFAKWLEEENTPLDNVERSILLYLRDSTNYKYIARTNDGDLFVSRSQPMMLDCGTLRANGCPNWINPFNNTFAFISNNDFHKIEEILNLEENKKNH